MKKAGIFLLLLGAVLTAGAQEQPKTGWSFVPLPNLGFSTDTGVALGAMSDFFYYGDGSVYPNYLHHLGFAAAYTTKGAWYAHAYFESPSLVKGIRLNASLTYRDAMVNNFYGFNGIAQPYDPALDANQLTRTAWYTNRRRIFRAAASAQGKITASLGWLGGVVARYTGVGDFSLERYDSGKSLFLAYHDAGLIRDDEWTGGSSVEFKAGLIWDSRDIERAPSRGILAELYLLSNTDIGRWKYHYGQLVAHYRQYISLWPEHLVLAFHLGLQHQVWGEMPFYNLNEIATLFYPVEEYDGLGSRVSVRGIRYNRIAAAGYAWGNFELRWAVADFRAFRQDFRLILNPFVDLAAITRPYRLEQQKALGFYQEKALPVMAGLGSGIKLQMNTNFMMSVDVGRGLDPQVGDWTIGMSSTYAF